jgi:hypothetical protein
MMKKTIAAATFVLLGAGGAAIGAIQLAGSDTLEDVTKIMLQDPACNPNGTLSYIGGGSSTGENAMRAGTQDVSPMSRAIGAGICTMTATATRSPATSANLFFCLDGLAIVANSNVAPGKPESACGLAFNTTVATSAGPYTFNAWQDILKVLFAGVDHNNVKDCNSPIRNALAASYNSVFQTACAGSGVCTGAIQHLFRRSDLSGTTDTFLSLVGLPAIATNPFCNGVGITTPGAGNADFVDNDPIRRPCVGRGDQAPSPTLPGSEQICNKVTATDATKNTLGLLLPIFVPETHTGLPADQVFPQQFCTFGFFAFRDNPAAITECPDGQNPANYAGTCLLPYQDTPTGPNFACISRANNRSIYLEQIAGDGRIYNMTLRRADAQILRDAPPRNRRLTGSFYRIHTNRILRNGSGTGCSLASSTTQIGCLVGASPCSLGFAGKEAALFASNAATALKVRDTAPTVANIQNLVLTPGNTADDYPISRKLYFNSVKYNQTIADADQAALFACFKNPAKAVASCEAGGFVRSPFDPQCEDFNEQTACGAASNVNACN